MVYISSAKLMLNDREIANIVKISQTNNQQHGITGILLYNSGNFMQLIEGDDAEVEGLYEKIRKDKRHSDVTLLFKETITHRNFENWLMGYRNLDTLKVIAPELLSPFLHEELDFSIYKNNPYRALGFLEMFKKIQS
jgi:hypothetical protein